MAKITVSNAELEIMKSLWKKSPQSFPEIVADVTQQNNWEKVTIKTMLYRLVGKKAISQSGLRRSYMYTALLSKEEYQESAAQMFLEQTFNGAAGAMLSFFMKHGKISRQDIQELEKEINELEK